MKLHLRPLSVHDWIFVAILLAATALRGLHLGRPSFYYDEVVTMRLAREPNPPALVRLMDQIDASRAPLQPLLLHGWIGIFGASDLAGRAFGAVCGVLTVALIYVIGRQAFDTPTALWGAWLGALWPLSVVLDRARQAADPASAAIAYQVTRRFSILGIISVAAILASGAVNTYEILGIAAFSLGTAYNRLLLAKNGLFAVLIAIAAVNRQRLTPRLADEREHRRAMRQLQWNTLAEVGLGLLILAIVAVLGRIPPHAHE